PREPARRRAHAVRQAGQNDRPKARAAQMGSHATRQRFGAEPVHKQWQMRAVLLDGAERQQDHAARIAREPRGLGPGALGEADHRPASVLHGVDDDGVVAQAARRAWRRPAALARGFPPRRLACSAFMRLWTLAGRAAFGARISLPAALRRMTSIRTSW